MAAVDLEVVSGGPGPSLGPWSVDCEAAASSGADAGGECSFLSAVAAAPLDVDGEVEAAAPSSPFSDCSFVGTRVAAPLDLEVEHAAAANTEECSFVAAVAGDACMLVNSDSDSDSSDSSSARSRSRERRRNVGAAAAAALVTAAQPLDVDEDERLVDRSLVLPTEDVMQLHQEGSIVAVMALTGAVIGVTPGQDDLSRCLVRIVGTEGAVGKAGWELGQVIQALKEKRVAAEAEAFLADMEKVEELRIPSRYVSAVIGNNGCDLPAIRSRCGGIMIAVAPPAETGGEFLVCMGPGDSQHVDAALRELTERLGRAQAEEKVADSTSQVDRGVNTQADGAEEAGKELVFM